jgi:hypothetical protein
MPKRSNEFQEVVYLVQRLLGQDSVVRESEELVDRVTQARREVDVCVHSTVAGIDILVSIECRTHERVQTVEWVDQMYGKHLNLPTNLLVLASSSGFTAQAQKLAATRGIETVTPGRSGNDALGGDGGRIRALAFRTARLQATRVVAVLDAADSLPGHHLLLDPTTRLFGDGGIELGTVSKYVGEVLGRLDSRKLLSDATGKATHFQVRGQPRHDLPSGAKSKHSNLFLRADGPDNPQFRRIHWFEVTGEITFDSAGMALEHREMRGREYAYGVTTWDDYEVLLVAIDPPTNGPPDPEKLTVRIRRRKGAS